MHIRKRVRFRLAGIEKARVYVCDGTGSFRISACVVEAEAETEKSLISNAVKEVMKFLWKGDFCFTNRTNNKKPGAEVLELSFITNKTKKSYRGNICLSNPCMILYIELTLLFLPLVWIF